MYINGFYMLGLQELFGSSGLRFELEMESPGTAPSRSKSSSNRGSQPTTLVLSRMGFDAGAIFQFKYLPVVQPEGPN